MSNNSNPFCLIGTSNNIRQMLYGDSVEQLEVLASERDLDFFAIYRNDPKFHSATQEEFLVCHRNDPYWINRGVASAA